MKTRFCDMSGRHPTGNPNNVAGCYHSSHPTLAAARELLATRFRNYLKHRGGDDRMLVEGLAQIKALTTRHLSDGPVYLGIARISWLVRVEKA